MEMPQYHSRSSRESRRKSDAYEPLIKYRNRAYISFDNVAVGYNEADGVMKHWISRRDYWQGSPRIIKMGGSPTDNNAIWCAKAGSVLILCKAGKIEIVADQGVDTGMLLKLLP
jgi:ABC-type xylose transport system substrate-binding protein